MTEFATREVTLTCPYCWELISIVADLSALPQDYVEDCEVCCRPLAIHVSVDTAVTAERSDA